MKFLLTLLFSATILFSQELAPMWLQDGWRVSRYPTEEWYTGFSRDKAKGNPGKAKFSAIEKDAQTKLSESISVQIQGTAVVKNAENQKSSGKNYSSGTSTDYKQIIKSASDAVLAKMETYSYFDKESGYIYGFAAVRKKDLADFYSSKINSLYSFADNEFSLSEQLSESGKKKSALNKIAVIEDSLARVNYWENLLQAVMGATSHNRSAEMQKKINTAKIELENGTAVYLNISGSEYVANELAGTLQEQGCNCSIAESVDEADYSVTVNAKLSRCNNATVEELYCYANATVKLLNTKIKKTISVKIPEVKGGSANNNKEKATEKAFKKLTDGISQQLVKEITK